MEFNVDMLGNSISYNVVYNGVARVVQFQADGAQLYSGDLEAFQGTGTVIVTQSYPEVGPRNIRRLDLQKLQILGVN